MDARHGSLPEDTHNYPHLHADSATARALRDIAFGSFAGMVSEVFEYPFDLAKVRLQSQVLESTSRYGGPLDCLKQTWRKEGVRGLYRGLPLPMFGAMAETAGLFVAYSQLQSFIRYASPRSASVELSITEHGLAAGGAGFLTSFILTPIELVKCKMQVQMLSPLFVIPSNPLRPPTSASQLRLSSFPWLPRRHRSTYLSPPNPLPINSRNPASALLAFTNPNPKAPTPKEPPGPLKIVNTIVRTQGLRGLWLGHTGTMFRETGGTAAWFASKEFFAAMLLARRSSGTVPFSHPSAHLPHSSQVALAPWESAVAGALSGALCVFVLYPADTVKSAIQTRDELRPSTAFLPARQLAAAAVKTTSSPSTVGGDLTFWGTARAMYRAQGLRGLYAGCGMTVARAIPSSGIVFVVYDGLSQRFG